VLLDDRNDPLDAENTSSVQAAVLAELGTLVEGSLTVRLLPAGRDVVATIVRNDEARRRIDIPLVAGR
jgi:hypothetical protein